jgi:hypothetical protein
MLLIRYSLLSLLVSLAMFSCSDTHRSSALLKDEEPLSPDIIGAFDGPVKIEDGVISFSMQFTNIGADMDEETPMFAKGFFVPKVAYENILAGQGMVPDTFSTSLNLRSGASTSAKFSVPMPSIPAGDYFFGVTFNTRAAPRPESEGLSLEAIPETAAAQLNNVTPSLADLGRLDGVMAAPRTGKYDLYHEVLTASIAINGSTANHRSRNILRVMEGDNQIPAKELWDNEISARFLFFDLAKGTASLGSYTANELDKVWTAISWQAEQDRAARAIHVDYYTNAPIVSHLPMGKYVLGVLMNITDRFTLDSYPENNLDLTFLNLSERRVLNLPKNVWLNYYSSSSATMAASVYDQSRSFDWSYTIDSAPEWLNITEAKSNYNYNLNFQVRPSAPTGIYEFAVTITAMNGQERYTEKSNLVVVKPDGPNLTCKNTGSEKALTPEDSNVTLYDINGVRYLSIEFEIENAGNQDLIYDVAEISGMQLELPSSRSVAPGSSHKIKSIMPLVGVSIPQDDAAATANNYVTFNSNIGYRYCELKYKTKAMLDHKLPQG